MFLHYQMNHQYLKIRSNPMFLQNLKNLKNHQYLTIQMYLLFLRNQMTLLYLKYHRLLYHLFLQKLLID